MSTQWEILLGLIQKSHSGDALKSWVFLVYPFTESWRMTFNCTHTDYRPNKLSRKITWQNVLRCVSGSKARLKKIQIFFRMCGSVMKPSPLLSIRPCQQQELCVLGISSTRWSPSETTALCKVHCVGCNIETLHNQTVLVLEWCWRDSNG